MRKLIGPLFLVVSSLCAPYLLADDETKPNLLVESCSAASSQSIRVVNENGKCSAYWKCDAETFKVLCEGDECKCYYDKDQKYYLGDYKACDSDQLRECYTR